LPLEAWLVRKKRCTFMIEPDLLERLHSVTARTGLSQSEQIRQGIRWWLESREWRIKAERFETEPEGKAVTPSGRTRRLRRR
jgi:Arc/MetJ-type ribon-helix-helix transcriptional regulator